MIAVKCAASVAASAFALLLAGEAAGAVLRVRRACPRAERIVGVVGVSRAAPGVVGEVLIDAPAGAADLNRDRAQMVGDVVLGEDIAVVVDASHHDDVPVRHQVVAPGHRTAAADVALAHHPGGRIVQVLRRAVGRRGLEGAGVIGIIAEGDDGGARSRPDARRQVGRGVLPTGRCARNDGKAVVVRRSERATNLFFTLKKECTRRPHVPHTLSSRPH